VVKGVCDGTVTRRPAWGGKSYRLPCDKPAAFALALYPDEDHVIEACRVHLPDMVNRILRGSRFRKSVDVQPVAKVGVKS
jgi:hypothetical protein